MTGLFVFAALIAGVWFGLLNLGSLLQLAERRRIRSAIAAQPVARISWGPAVTAVVLLFLAVMTL